jgi:hypothetical protein
MTSKESLKKKLDGMEGSKSQRANSLVDLGMTWLDGYRRFLHDFPEEEKLPSKIIGLFSMVISKLADVSRKAAIAEMKAQAKNEIAAADEDHFNGKG